MAESAHALLPPNGVIDLARPGGADLLVRGWRQLEAAASLPTQDAHFTLALSRTMLAGSAIALFLAGGVDDPEALVPLCHAGGFLSRWRLPGAREVYEPGDALYRDAAAARALARRLARLGRPLELDRVPADSAMIPALAAAMEGRGWLTLRPATACPRISLDAAWAEPEGRFNAGRRSDFRRAARRAAEFGEVSFEALSPSPEHFDALFDEAIAVEQQGWKRDAGTAIASEPAKEAFFRSYLRSAAERGILRVSFMRIDGKAVAMQLAVEWAGRYWLYKIGHDEAYARCSPGTLLMLHAIGDAARRGLTGFELMGDVEPWIVEFWTREQVECVRLRTYPANPRGAIAFLADAFTWLRARIAGRMA